MVMRWEQNVQIQDMRNHPPELIQGLETLLMRGTSLNPDPKHPGFFEVHDDTQVYYVHVVPESGKVLFLAAWPQAQLAVGCCA